MGAHPVIIALVSSPAGEDFYVVVPYVMYAYEMWSASFVKGVWDLGA